MGHCACNFTIHFCCFSSLDGNCFWTLRQHCLCYSTPHQVSKKNELLCWIFYSIFFLPYIFSSNRWTISCFWEGSIPHKKDFIKSGIFYLFRSRCYIFSVGPKISLIQQPHRRFYFTVFWETLYFLSKNGGGVGHFVSNGIFMRDSWT